MEKTAFPHPGADFCGNVLIYPEKGLTTFEYIAIKAMTALLSTATPDTNPCDVAKEACAYAEALVLELRRKEKERQL